MMLLSLIISSLLAHSAEPSLVYDNNLGVAELKAGQKKDARSHFLKAMEDSELAFASGMNMGLSFESDKQMEEALKEYRQASRNQNLSDEQKYQAHYNVGRALQLLERKDEALTEYQSALKLRPDAYDVKHNIELMFQGGGQGGGKSDNKKSESGDDKDENKNQQPKDTDPEEQKKEAQSKPKELNEKDVQKILEELKNQEQEIRAKEYSEEPKNSQVGNGKDW